MQLDESLFIATAELEHVEMYLKAKHSGKK